MVSMGNGRLTCLTLSPSPVNDLADEELPPLTSEANRGDQGV